MEMVLVCLGLFASVYSTVLGVIRIGLKDLSFFTTESNILAAIVMFLLLSGRISGRGGNSGSENRGSENRGSGSGAGFRNGNEKESAGVVPAPLYFVTLVAITVTFLVYLLILAPTHEKGFIGAYQDNYYASLMAHIVAPVCTVLHYYLFNTGAVRKKQVLPLSILFPLAYVVFVYFLGKAGVVWTDRNLSMPYNFLNYKAPCGWFGMRLDTMGPDTLGVGVAYMVVILIMLFIIIGAVLWFIKARVRRRKKLPEIV